MAIDASKLQAFAHKGKPAPTDPNAPDANAPESGEQDAQAEEETKYAELVPLLTQFQDDIEQCYEELDGNTLGDPEMEMEPEDFTIMREGVDGLDPSLQKALKRLLPGIEQGAAMDLADQLFNEDGTSDPDKLAGWLVRVGEMLSSGGAPQGDENAPDAGDEDDLEDMG